MAAYGVEVVFGDGEVFLSPEVACAHLCGESEVRACWGEGIMGAEARFAELARAKQRKRVMV